MEAAPKSLITVVAPMLAFIGGLIGGYKFLKEEISEDATNAVHIETLRAEVTALRGQHWQDAERLVGRIDKMDSTHDELVGALSNLEKKLLILEVRAQTKP